MPRRAKLTLGLTVVVAGVMLAAALLWLGELPESLFADWKPAAAGKVWTVTGTPTAPAETFIDADGSFQPGLRRYSIRFYLFDAAAHELVIPSERVRARRSLIRGWMPAPRVCRSAKGLTLATATFALGYGGRNTCFTEAVLTNASARRRSVYLYAAILPYEILGSLHGRSGIGYDTKDRTVLLNGKPLLLCDERPDGFGAVWCDPRRTRLLDATSYIRQGEIPPDESVPTVPKGITSAALRYRVDLAPGAARDFRFASVLPGLGGRAARPSALGEARRRFLLEWEPRSGTVQPALADRRAENAYRASLAYLIVLARDGVPQPGPSKYRAFWVRDFAYVAQALYDAGRVNLAKPGLNQVRRMQLAKGGFAASTAARTDDELDAPGQAIYALVGCYRHTGDREQLARDWPAILAACRYVKARRAGNRFTDPTRRGILPSSRSAEDIGSPTIQHYWDDFWCVRGLRDAAYAAAELGHDGEARWIRREAEDLQAATLSSIRAVMARHKIDYIPNSPDEVTSSAMARGTSCAIWPCAVLDPSDPLVKRSFEVYWRKWIAPSGGGFVHKGSFWPYAGLDLAHCYLILGQRERAEKILRWTLDHDPTRGFLAWPEGMSRQNLTLAVGDMPHGWFCASYISLVRSMYCGR